MQNFALRLRGKAAKLHVIAFESSSHADASFDGHPSSIRVSAIEMKFIDMIDPFFKISRADLTEGENERQTWT